MSRILPVRQVPGQASASSKLPPATTSIESAVSDWDDVDDHWGRDDDLVAASGLEQTRDDTDVGWGEALGDRSGHDADLERYLRERPPHHGD
jgi:hypothetical protein